MIKLFVTEFAERKQNIEKELSSHSVQIIENILKLMIMSNHSAYNHWKKEIATHLNKIDSLKGSHKFPTKSQIIKWTYDKHKEWLQDKNWLTIFMYNIESEYNYKSEITIDNLFKFADSITSKYFTWLAEELSKHGIVSNNSIYVKLDILLAEIK